MNLEDEEDEDIELEFMSRRLSGNKPAKAKDGQDDLTDEEMEQDEEETPQDFEDESDKDDSDQISSDDDSDSSDDDDNSDFDVHDDFAMADQKKGKSKLLDGLPEPAAAGKGRT